MDVRKELNHFDHSFQHENEYYTFYLWEDELALYLGSAWFTLPVDKWNDLLSILKDELAMLKREKKELELPFRMVVQSFLKFNKLTDEQWNFLLNRLASLDELGVTVLSFAESSFTDLSIEKIQLLASKLTNCHFRKLDLSSNSLKDFTSTQWQALSQMCQSMKYLTEIDLGANQFYLMPDERWDAFSNFIRSGKFTMLGLRQSHLALFNEMQLKALFSAIKEGGIKKLDLLFNFGPNAISYYVRHVLKLPTGDVMIDGVTLFDASSDQLFQSQWKKICAAIKDSGVEEIIVTSPQEIDPPIKKEKETELRKICETNMKNNKALENNLINSNLSLWGKSSENSSQQNNTTLKRKMSNA